MCNGKFTGFRTPQVQKIPLFGALALQCSRHRGRSSFNSCKATKEYLDSRGTKIRTFRVCLHSPFLPPFFPHSSPPFPLQAVSPFLPLSPLHPAPFQKNPFSVRKIFVRNSGVIKMAAPFLWAPGKMAFFLSAGKTHVHKIPPFQGGGGSGGGGGGVPILFLWAQGFF